MWNLLPQKTFYLVIIVIRVNVTLLYYLKLFLFLLRKLLFSYATFLVIHVQIHQKVKAKNLMNEIIPLYEYKKN